jgi:hypothetical protein
VEKQIVWPNHPIAADAFCISGAKLNSLFFFVNEGIQSLDLL